MPNGDMSNNLTLGITKIGDLLIGNRLTKTEPVIENIHLSIPDYQRPYKWTARNAIQLLDDITEARDANKGVYRVGTLILHEHKDDQGAICYDIVDGQQRLITFSLLLRALQEQEKEQEKEKKVEIKLLDEEIPESQNILKNLNAFRRRIVKKEGDSTLGQPVQDVKRLYDFIKDQCELVVVITKDLSTAFQFFDSQNARGKGLYPHDLLKAFHLREMADIDVDKTEKIVAEWERIPQWKLHEFFGEYLYRLKEWMNGNRANKLDEDTIHTFKGITKNARTPYAQFYKGAFSYAELVNSSAMPFVTGTRNVTAFQLDAPIIAGEAFFNYTKHYYRILEDIRDNSKYEGFYIQDNPIVKTLDNYFNDGSGNRIARLLFDTALLLYVDRFCPATFPLKTDIELFEQFVIYAFVWAYSLRAQYTNLGWTSAQNFILGNEGKEGKINSFNIYRHISAFDGPVTLLSSLADKLFPISKSNVRHSRAKKGLEEHIIGVENYMHFFSKHKFYTEQ